MSNTESPSSSAVPLTQNPLARVAALALALGTGIVAVALALPAALPASESGVEPRATSVPDRTSEAAVAPGSTPARASEEHSEPSTAKAIRSVVAALTADGDVPEQGSSRMPRPSSAGRIYQGSVDDTSIMTVYAASGAPQAALAAYTAVLKEHGFTFADQRPATDDAADRNAPVPTAKTVRVFTKGELEALVTVSQGEASALLTVIEGPRRGRS
jgi:hypothetical protein